MKYTIKIITIICLGFLFSCRSSQEMVYLNDAINNEIIEGLTLQKTEHTIRPGDILYISIKSLNPENNILFNPEANMEVTGTGQGYQKYTTPSGAYLYGYEVAVDGQINLPVMGKIHVAGLPVTQIETKIQAKADEFLKDAIVKVKLLNFKITVLGEVRNPGVFYNYNNSITVLEAIAMASGNTDYANIHEVMVIRPFPEGKKTYLLNLNSKDIYLSDAFYLKPNDYVIVRPDKYKIFQLNGQAYSLFFSSLSALLLIVNVMNLNNQ